MAKTDRQTDKATWWSVTGFNEEIAILSDNTKWPVEVVKVYGGVEECEKTGRLHFQGAVQLHKQQRMSWFKSWLPTAHLEVARSKDMLIKYCMKEETAVGPKLEVSNSVTYMRAEEVCIMLMDSIYDDFRKLEDAKVDDKDFMFWCAVNRCLEKDVRLSGQLMNPTLKSWFRNTMRVWYSKVREQREKAESTDDESVLSHA